MTYQSLRWALLVVVVLVVFVYADTSENDTCTPFTYTCGPIAPTPPTSYLAKIEAVDMLVKTTSYLEEHYDYDRRILAVTELGQQIYTHSIFYYDINVVAVMTTYFGIEDGVSRVECVTAPMSDVAPWMTGHTTSNGTLFTLAPSQALFFGGSFKYSWVNNASERTVPCNRWDACILTDRNGAFNVQYHWSDPTRVQDMYGYTSERPVTVRVNGKVYPIQGSLSPIPVDMMYNFALFDDRPDLQQLRWAFEIPSNVYCPGLPELKQPPTQLADAFSMRVEVTEQSNALGKQEFVSTIKNWYDRDRRLTRSDTIPNSASTEYEIAGPVEVSIIRDFTSGVEYVIDKTLGNCTALPIANTGFDTITNPDGSISIKDPLLLFGMGEVENLTYYGTKYARGLPCDVWLGHLDYISENETVEDAYLYEVYFLQSDWREDSGATSEPDRKYPEPILIKVQQDITIPELQNFELLVDLEENIFKFEEEEPSIDIYDITPCFSGHDHIRRFQIAFPGSFRESFDKDPVGFSMNVQETLVLQLSIPLIRVQHLLIEFDEKDGWLYCEFTMVDIPQVDNIELPDTVGPPLPTVVDELDHLISTYFCVVVYDTDFDNPGHIKLMVAYNDSLRELYEDECHPLREHKHQQGSAERKASVDQNKEMQVALNIHRNTHNDIDKRKTTDTLSKPSKTENAFGPSFIADLLAIIRGPKQDTLLYMQPSFFSKEGMTKSSSPTYGPGDMAGMGVGMFLTGVLLGCVVMYIGLSKFGLTNNNENIPMTSRT